MKKILLSVAVTGMLTATGLGVNAQTTSELPDTFLIPERAVTIGGDPKLSNDLVAILYNTHSLHFSDPRAPRFLFLDRKGRVAMGIGGYVKGTMQYDFDGAINDGGGFNTFAIPVPADPAMRNRFFANANHSTVFLQMVGRTERFNSFEVYVRTDFTGGGPTAYGVKLKQAYLRLGYVTAGLAQSVFVDGAAGTPVIDVAGPAGEMSATNIGLFYKPNLGKGWSMGVSVELPEASYTTAGSQAESMPQRVPDIPVYVEYDWAQDRGHIRLSGLWRNLSYRNLERSDNRFVTGWAVQLSGASPIFAGLGAYWQGAIGQGYARYINGIAERGFDLVPSASDPGKLVAPTLSNFELGLRYDFTPKFYMTCAYSEAHLMRTGHYNLADDTYKYSRYLSVSGFYNMVGDLTVGLEYLHGQRVNLDGDRAGANRINAMLQYTF